MCLPDDLTVLIVEDNRAQARLIEIFLAELGCANPTTIMKRGDAAWDFLFGEKGEHPSSLLVFLDLNLPGVHGHDLLREMRKRKETAAIPVIVITSSVDPDEEKRCRDLGADAYIQKPPSLDVLRNTFESIGIFRC